LSTDGATWEFCCEATELLADVPKMPAVKKEAAAATPMFRKIVFFIFISSKARGELEFPISVLGLQRPQHHGSTGTILVELELLAELVLGVDNHRIVRPGLLPVRLVRLCHVPRVASRAAPVSHSPAITA
jgi:hypothetical protein